MTKERRRIAIHNLERGLPLEAWGMFWLYMYYSHEIGSEFVAWAVVFLGLTLNCITLSFSKKENK